jgi:hypothetical protein
MGFVQAAHGASFSGTTATATLTGVGANTIRVAVALNPSSLTVSSVKDGVPNTYNAGPVSGAGGGYTLSGFWFKYASAGGSVTITATASGTITGAMHILMEEWSGDAASPYDGGSAAYTADGTAGTNLPAGSFTTTVSGDDIWCAIAQPSTSTACSVGSGFTLVSNFLGASTPWQSEHEIQGSAGAINPNWSSATGSFDNLVMAMAFKPGSAPFALLDYPNPLGYARVADIGMIPPQQSISLTQVGNILMPQISM